MARLPESPRRLNTHWSENLLWSENQHWSENLQINLTILSTSQLKPSSWTLPTTDYPDNITRWFFVTISRSQLNQIPQRLWLLKEVVTIVIMTALRTILPQHRQGSNQQIWSYDQPGSNCRAKAGVYEKVLFFGILSILKLGIHTFQSVTIQTAGMHY